MVDRAARRQLALLLRRYASGRIDEDHLIDSLPKSRLGDVALEEFEAMAWELVHDNPCPAPGSPPPDGHLNRRDVARWVLFLHSDEEYRWPRRNPNNWLVLLVGVFGFYAAFLGPLAVWADSWVGPLVGCMSSCFWVFGAANFYLTFVQPHIERIRAKTHGGDLSLWPFHDAEHFARAAKRHRTSG